MNALIVLLSATAALAYPTNQGYWSQVNSVLPQVLDSQEVFVVSPSLQPLAYSVQVPQGQMTPVVQPYSAPVQQVAPQPATRDATQQAQYLVRMVPDSNELFDDDVYVHRNLGQNQASTRSGQTPATFGQGTPYFGSLEVFDAEDLYEMSILSQANSQASRQASTRSAPQIRTRYADSVEVMDAEDRLELSLLMKALRSADKSTPLTRSTRTTQPQQYHYVDSLEFDDFQFVQQQHQAGVRGYQPQPRYDASFERFDDDFHLVIGSQRLNPQSNYPSQASQTSHQPQAAAITA